MLWIAGKRDVASPGWLPLFEPPQRGRPCGCEADPAVFGHTSCPLMTLSESTAAARLAEPPIVIS
jgi:hypothetical protein